MSISRLSHDAPPAESPRLVMGRGRVAAVTAEAEAAAQPTGRPLRVLLVVGGGFPGRSWRERLLGALRPVRLQVARQSGMPTPGCVTRLAGQARAHRADVIVAVGGGSVMDAAKAAGALAGEPVLTDRLVAEACRIGAPAAGLPVVAVPTTPGTGAESTPFATIWDRAGGRKLSLHGPAVRPFTAILDPDLLRDLPAAQLASSLLDALSQGIEAAWSVRADEQSQALGAAAWAQLADFLDRPSRPLDPAERQAALLAGHYAGRAIAIAGTTLCHALSYPLTLRYGLSHGHACGVVLAPVLRYNAAVREADCADPRGPERVRDAVDSVVRAAGADDPGDLARRVESYLAAANLPPVMGSQLDAGWIAAEALGYDRAGGNPRRIKAGDLARMLSALS